MNIRFNRAAMDFPFYAILQMNLHLELKLEFFYLYT